MFRSLSIFGTLYTLAIIVLLGIMVSKVYDYYQANDGNLMAFVNEPLKFGDLNGDKSVKTKIAQQTTSTDSMSITNVDENRLNVSPNTTENVENKSVKPTSSKNTESTKKPVEKPIEKAQLVSVDDIDKAPAKPRKASYKTSSMRFDYSSNGSFVVLAGSFSLSSNALLRVQELQQSGFKNAQIVRFDNSVLETVMAGRFASKQEAEKLVEALKQNSGIRAYVHRQM